MKKIEIQNLIDFNNAVIARLEAELKDTQTQKIVIDGRTFSRPEIAGMINQMKLEKSGWERLLPFADKITLYVDEMALYMG